MGGSRGMAGGSCPPRALALTPQLPFSQDDGFINQSKFYFLSNRNITVYTVYASGQKAAREAYAH